MTLTTAGHTIPLGEPARLIAGDTATWLRDEPDYRPADSWVLSYDLLREQVKLTTITATDNGDGTHLVSVTAATTAEWAPGEYAWQAYVTKSTERYTRGRGIVDIVENFVNLATGHDYRSTAKRMLDAVDDLLLGKALGADAINYSIGGRSLTRMTPDELWVWRQRLQTTYSAEKAALANEAGKGSGNRIRVKFTS